MPAKARPRPGGECWNAPPHLRCAASLLALHAALPRLASDPGPARAPPICRRRGTVSFWRVAEWAAASPGSRAPRRWAPCAARPHLPLLLRRRCRRDAHRGGEWGEAAAHLTTPSAQSAPSATLMWLEYRWVGRARCATGSLATTANRHVSLLGAGHASAAPCASSSGPCSPSSRAASQSDLRRPSWCLWRAYHGQGGKGDAYP